MLRILFFFLLGYIAWTIIRIMQRMNRMRQTGRQAHDPVQSAPDGRKSKGEFPEIRDAEFEDIDPKKGDDA